MKKVVLVFLAALGIAACGSQPVVKTAAAPKTVSSAAPTSKPAQNAGVGATLTATSENGAMYSVTLVQVVDPAQSADQFLQPNAGNRFVAVVFRLTGVKGSLQDDADNDAAIIGSDQQTYTPSLADTTAGTDFDNGSFTLTAGQSLTGAVSFEMPQSVKVAVVEWNPDSGFSTQQLRWTV
jgi:hypothetical protein